MTRPCAPTFWEGALAVPAGAPCSMAHEDTSQRTAGLQEPAQARQYVTSDAGVRMNAVCK